MKKAKRIPFVVEKEGNIKNRKETSFSDALEAMQEPKEEKVRKKRWWDEEIRTDDSVTASSPVDSIAFAKPSGWKLAGCDQSFFVVFFSLSQCNILPFHIYYKYSVRVCVSVFFVSS